MIAFISCVKTKKPFPCKAIDLYDSALFKKSVAYAKSKNVQHIYIISAKYGLVSSDKIISPYEETLNGKNDKHIKRWTYKVIKQADSLGISRDEEILFLGGENYLKYLRLIYKNSHEPLKGLSIGRRLKFLNENIMNRK